MNPDGRIALVTGAASGIGRASARLLASRGAFVIVGDIDERAAAETAAAIESAGGAAASKRLDVGDAADFARVFEEIADEHGAVQILHNSAGIVTGPPDFPDASAERVAQVIAVNVIGAMVGTRLAVPAMRRSGGGAIVNMSSLLALATEHADPVYCASKSAVRHFTELCRPLARTHGVRVNAVLPGGVDTPILSKTGAGGAPAAWLAQRLAEIELLSTDAIAAVVLELVEDDTRAGEAIEVRNSERSVA